MQPSEISLNAFGFLTVYLDLPSPLSLYSVLLVANASSVLFIISQLFTHLMASGATLAYAFDSLGALVEVDVLLLVDDFTVSGPMIILI